MGTMIQRLKLTGRPTSAARASRIIRSDLKGNSDLLVLTRPDDIAGDSRAVSRGRRRHHRNQHLHGDQRSRRPTTDSSTLAYEINVEGARIARRVADEWTATHAGSAALRRRLDGADQSDAVDLAGRQQRVVPRVDLRRDARRPTPSRRSG